MGMFDHVYYKGEEYQTGNFDCVMDLYFISRKKLYRERWFLGKKKRKRRVMFHGMFNFYDIENNYLAKFIDGVLVSIKKIPD